MVATWGAAAAYVNQEVWLQVLAQDAQELLCECLGTAQGITARPLMAASNKSSQYGRQLRNGYVHGRRQEARSRKPLGLPEKPCSEPRSCGMLVSKLKIGLVLFSVGLTSG